MRKTILTFAVTVLSFMSIQAQQKYFVDGFHGGVYGHYPLMTYTQFIVDQMNKHPKWYIGLEIEPETWDTVKVKTPEAYFAFQKKMDTDQAEYTNPSYAQSYLYCIDGESIIRQFYYGIKKTREHFPNITIATYSVEEPCFTSCIPGILSQFGFRHAVLKCPNTCWGGYSAPYGGELVNFIGPDGTSMLSVPRYACEELEPKTVWQTTAWGNQPKYFNACFNYGIKNPVAMTYQDAGWTNGPWIGTDEGKLNGTVYTRWTKYIEEQSVKTTTDDYHFSQEDVRPGLMWGSQVLQRLAQQCRRSEFVIPQAEKIAAMAQIDNGFTLNQAKIDEAWRTLMLSQHHDCWIVPYNRLNRRGSWADNVTLWTEESNKLSHDVMEEAFASYKAEGNPALKVYNTSGYPRKEVINASLKDGRVMDLEVEVPAFGYTVIPTSILVEAKDTKSIKVSSKECTLENDLYRIVLDLTKGAVVKSLKVKSSGYDYVGKNADYSFGELRGFFDETKRFMSSKENSATVKVLADNELVRSIEVTGNIAGTTFYKTITLRKGSPVIDCSLKVDWKRDQKIGDFTRPMKKTKEDKRTSFYDSRYALSLMLPTAQKETKLYKSAPFDVCESKLDNTFYNDWDSIKHNVIEEWVDLKSSKDNHSIALLVDHTTSYSYGTDYPLALTVQYSGPGLWGINYDLKGATEFKYALIPHQGMWDEARISQQSRAWNEKLVAINSYSNNSMSHSLVDVADSGYDITSVTSDGDDILLRLFNASGDASQKQIKVSANVVSATLVDFLGNEIAGGVTVEKKADSSLLNVNMPRFGVKTYKIKIRK